MGESGWGIGDERLRWRGSAKASSRAIGFRSGEVGGADEASRAGLRWTDEVSGVEEAYGEGLCCIGEVTSAEVVFEAGTPASTNSMTKG